MAFYNFPWDKVSPGPVVIDTEHHRIHEGQGFISIYRANQIASTQSASFMLSAPAGVVPHLRLTEMTASAGPMSINMFEGVTTSDDGTPNDVLNLNRNSTKVNEVELFSEPTITDFGTLLEQAVIYAIGTGKATSGGNLGDFPPEWIGKADTKYLFQVQNNTTGTEDIMFRFFWYEPGLE